MFLRAAGAGLLSTCVCSFAAVCEATFFGSFWQAKKLITRKKNGNEYFIFKANSFLQVQKTSGGGEG
jgi:hypothetical protein